MSMFHMERCSRNTLIIIIIIVVQPAAIVGTLQFLTGQLGLYRTVQYWVVSCDCSRKPF